jgi:hypothetical protein
MTQHAPLAVGGAAQYCSVRTLAMLPFSASAKFKSEQYCSLNIGPGRPIRNAVLGFRGISLAGLGAHRYGSGILWQGQGRRGHRGNSGGSPALGLRNRIRAAQLCLRLAARKFRPAGQVKSPQLGSRCARRFVKIMSDIIHVPMQTHREFKLRLSNRSMIRVSSQPDV